MPAILKIAIVCFILLFSLPTASQKRDAVHKPNVVYIYADDLGYGELGCYGQQKIKTPNLDRMAAEGLRFTQHYTGAPVCAPARCMLLTGKHAGHAYIRGNYELGGFADSAEGGQMPLAENTFTIAKLMKQAGYATAAIGKWGLGMSNTTGDPNKQGFDYFYGYLDQKQAHNYYPSHLWENGRRDVLNNPLIDVHAAPLKDATDTAAFNRYKGNDYALDRLMEKGLRFIRQHKNTPFFLYLPLTAPHLSLQAPDAAVHEYVGHFDEQPYLGQKGYVPCRYPRSTYAALITYMDKQIGRLLELIKELGLDENTMVLFSSDNGATFDTGGADPAFFNSTGRLRGRKQEVYEGGIRIPFLARWPGKIGAGRTTGLLSTQYDVMATLSELTGVNAAPEDAVSFLPELLGNGKAQKTHEYLYFEFPERGGQIAVRMSDWKGVKKDLKKKRAAPWELYNLKTDRNETSDVAAQHPDLIKQLDAIVQREHRPAHIREWEFVDPKFEND